MKKISLLVVVALLAIGSAVFAPSAAQAASLAGSTVRIDGTLYFITSDGLRRPFMTENVYLSYGSRLDKVSDGTAEDATLPVGAPMIPRDGTVVCSNSTYDWGTCYLMTDYKKAAFASQGVLRAQGYDLKRAIYADVSLVPSDKPITDGSEAHRYGTLIELDGTVYFVGKNSLMGIPNLATLESWDYTLADVVKGNEADKARGVNLVTETRFPNEARPFEPIIPTSLNLSNEDKFIVPFSGKTLPIMESWLYSPEERSIHGATQHGGIDFAHNRGTPIYAAADGYAISSTQLAPLARTYQDKQVGFGLGEFVQIWHPKQGVYTSYSHLQKVAEHIPYFKPNCANSACDPEVVYNSVDYMIKHGRLVKQGELIGWMGDSGLSWGYPEKPRIERDVAKYPSWDEVHLHFEMYTRDNVNFYKAKRYDPFGIYGRLYQYDEQAYSNPNSLWKLDANNQPVLAQ